ncbi:MAG: HEAT repeat domain-containing protein [Nostoc sp.]|uniref:HEAT repeat domain-containing protein n=1 Tax=Nostoc sp. TaxID=1180 RepID=UPI002FF5B8D8
MSNYQEQNDIHFLIQQLYTSQDKTVIKQAAEGLGFTGNNNSDSITALIQLVCTTPDEPTRWIGIESLGKIGNGNHDVIQTLISLLGTSRILTRRIAAQSLAKIAASNQQVIAALDNLAQSSKDEVTRQAIAYILGRIGKDNQQASKTLIYLIDNSQVFRKIALLPRKKVARHWQP